MEQESLDATEFESNPTPLMRALNHTSTTSDWQRVQEIIYDDSDSSWQQSLDWRWPEGEYGPEGMTCLHIAANKTDPGEAQWPHRRQDCLYWLFVAAIRRGFDLKRRIKSGATLLHQIITYANYAMLRALHDADVHVYETYPETNPRYYVDWAVKDSNGKTPLGHWIISRQQQARNSQQQWMFDFLADRLESQGWTRDQIRRHEQEQKALGEELRAEKKVAMGKKKAVPSMRHTPGRQRSPMKRRRIDDGAPSERAAASSAAGPRSPSGDPPARVVEEHRGNRWGGGKGGGHRHKGGSSGKW